MGDLPLATPSGQPLAHVDHVGMVHLAPSGETPVEVDQLASGGGDSEALQVKFHSRASHSTISAVHLGVSAILLIVRSKAFTAQPN